MSGGFDVRGAGIRSRTEIGASAVDFPPGAGAGGLNPAAAGSPAQSCGGRGNKREFTEDDDQIVRKVMRGTISRENARLLLGCGREQIIRRMAELAWGASAPSGAGRRPRPFTEQEDDIIRQAAAGTISRERAQRRIGCGYQQINRRCAELGLTWPLKPIAARAADPSRPVAARTTRPRQAEPSSTNSAPGMTAAGGASSPPPPAGWVVIARHDGTRWRDVPGAEVRSTDARGHVALGRALTTQRRVPGGFELLFRWRA